MGTPGHEVEHGERCHRDQTQHGNRHRTALGQAPGFGAEPFAEFDRAQLSVRLLPLLLRLPSTRIVSIQQMDSKFEQHNRFLRSIYIEPKMSM